VFRANLTILGERIQAAGAELVLMTPNLVAPEEKKRSIMRLREFAQIVREVGKALGARVADCAQRHETMLANDRDRWVTLMSDQIHPNMRGHKLFAEEVTYAITGRRVALEELPPLSPALPRMNEALGSRRPVKVVAMKPYHDLIGPALRRLHPAAEVRVTAWDPANKSLQTLNDEARKVGFWSLRGKQNPEHPDLIIIAVPAAASAENDEQFYRNYTAVLNWSLDVGASSQVPRWDCLVILPEVAQPGLAEAKHARAHNVVAGQDIPVVKRAMWDLRSADQVLLDALRAFQHPQ
jgi:hypothetical protein